MIIKFKNGSMMFASGEPHEKLRGNMTILNFYYYNDKLHLCDKLRLENEDRAADGESEIFVFQDIEYEHWNIRVGMEFLKVNFCPYCGEKLNGTSS